MRWYCITIALISSLYGHTQEELYLQAYALKEQARLTEAIASYEEFLLYNPDHVHAHIGLAQAQLMLGNLRDGFAHLEWHLGAPNPDTWWLNDHLKKYGSFHGIRILLRTEWGLGDTLQFIRYAQVFKLLGATVYVELQKQLAPLLSSVPYIDKIILPTDTLEPFHAQLPFLSMPAVFDTTLENIPTNIPYIQANSSLVAMWHDYFATDTSFKIGICWHGNTIHTPEKFIPLNLLASLAHADGAHLYSLQKQHGLDQLKTLIDASLIRLLPHDIDTDNGCFVDTAAIMENLDLIITVDTAIAHLAGALGKPVWVILPYHADWRWMKERQDSPWYPSMKLFRQSQPGNWHSVVEQIRWHLQEIMKEKLDI